LRKTQQLRHLLAAGKPLVVPGCYNALTAKILAQAGFPALYMTGYGTSLGLLGLPDAGFATMTEMTQNARHIAAAIDVPLIADADNGYGNAVNVSRTVDEYIRSGAAAIHLEDQVLPKRCGHVAGKAVIALDEAVGKVRAACAARDAMDRDFVLIARTDARGVQGGSIDAAIERANAYLDAGADMAFVEGPASRGELERVCREVRGPLFYNMTGISPRLKEEELAELGVALVILPGTMLRVTIAAAHDFASALRREGLSADTETTQQLKSHPVGDLHAFSGFDRVRELERRFLPEGDQNKYDGALGFHPQAAQATHEGA